MEITEKKLKRHHEHLERKNENQRGENIGNSKKRKSVNEEVNGEKSYA